MIPSNSNFLPVAHIFSAVFGAVTPAIYDFGVAGNARQRLLQLFPNRLYCIKVLNNSANVPEAAYVSNILTIPSIFFALEATNPVLFGRSYPLLNYLVNNEIYAFFRSAQRKDWLIATVTGTLSQDASLVGYDPISMAIALNIFEITDKKFLSEYYQRKEEDGAEMVDVPAELVDRV